jgi:hypothetical protein
MMMFFVLLLSMSFAQAQWQPISADAKQLVGDLVLTEKTAKFSKGLILEFIPESNYMKVVKVDGPKGILNQICGQSKIVAFTTHQSIKKGYKPILKAGFYSAPPDTNPDFQPNLCVEYRFIPVKGAK